MSTFLGKALTNLITGYFRNIIGNTDQIIPNDIVSLCLMFYSIYSKAMANITPYTLKMMIKKIDQIMQKLSLHSRTESPYIQFPAPYNIKSDEKNNKLKTMPISCCPLEQNEIYQIPAIDEYFGPLSVEHKYDKINECNLENESSNEVFSDSNEAKEFFDEVIYKLLYTNKYGAKRVRSQLFNEWSDEEMKNCAKQTLELSEEEVLDELWLDLIAFCGHASHRVQPHNGGMDRRWKIDVSFLSLYNVRDGYLKYGAIAYFNSNFRVTQIYVSHNEQTYKKGDDGWEHAKWCWKVSVSVATFLVDMVCHCRFREMNGLIKAMQNALNPNHPIRRLMLPFIYGSVHSNCAFNEYLKKGGLFHRCFAFEYDDLSKLIKDSMSDRPKVVLPLKEEDKMKYNFRLIKVR